MKLDKWIRGAQIWAGISWKKDNGDVKGVVGGWKRSAKGQEEGKDICVVGLHGGRLRCKNSPTSAKKDKTVINFPSPHSHRLPLLPHLLLLLAAPARTQTRACTHAQVVTIHY